MKKRFKRKTKINIKKITVILIIILIFLILNYISIILKKQISNETIIKSTFKISNTYSYSDKDNNYKKIYSYIKDNLFNSPVNLLKNELGYEIENNKIDFVYVESKPKIYLYNSHQGENYSREYLEEHNIIPNVLTASFMLKDKLDSLGINTIVEESDILEYMKKNNLDHAGSYKASRFFLTKAIKNYPSVELFIDIHRDAITHNLSTTVINGKPCAKLLFVIGLEYNTYENNLKIVTKINEIINKKYPSLSRGIMKKQGYGVNGIYNQDLASNVILIEVGGNENNIEEVNNTLDLLAITLGEYLNEKR